MSVSANIIRTLVERDWVRVVGHRDVPGHPEMLGTTRAFLDYFGLKKLDDLPPLADLADWESLRVQLNLPEVEDDAETGDTNIVPVLYPEIPEEESREAPAAAELDESLEVEALPELEAFEDDIEDDEELVVSDWPDPLEGGR